MHNATIIFNLICHIKLNCDIQTCKKTLNRKNVKKYVMCKPKTQFKLESINQPSHDFAFPFCDCRQRSYTAKKILILLLRNGAF